MDAMPGKYSMLTRRLWGILNKFGLREKMHTVQDLELWDKNQGVPRSICELFSSTTSLKIVYNETRQPNERMNVT